MSGKHGDPIVQQSQSEERIISTCQNCVPTSMTEVFEDYRTAEEVSIKSFTYKKVANQIKPVATTLPEQFKIVRKIPNDPLADLLILPVSPPEFMPGKRYNLERKEKMAINKDQFLWLEEEKLAHYLGKVHELAFAWTENEKEIFLDEYFEPVIIPIIEHVPWVLRNIPIPPEIYNHVVELINTNWNL